MTKSGNLQVAPRMIIHEAQRPGDHKPSTAAEGTRKRIANVGKKGGISETRFGASSKHSTAHTGANFSGSKGTAMLQTQQSRGTSIPGMGRPMTKNLVPLRHEGRLGDRIVPPDRDTGAGSTVNANKSFKSLSGMSSSVGGRRMEKSKS